MAAFTGGTGSGVGTTTPTSPGSTTTTRTPRPWRRGGGGGGSAEDPSGGGDREQAGGHDTFLEKTHEFFQMCDVEDKGFVTRRDMQRLNGQLPLSADQLEDVFDKLDSDGNGYLTLDEFSRGFSEFLNGRRISSVERTQDDTGPCENPPETLYQSQWEERLHAGVEDDEEKHFCMLMESLGASTVFEDPEEVRSLWAQLRRDEPHLLSNFEEFLARVTSQIKEANQEKWEMESALQRKAATHDDEIHRLYEEMELQIKNEKDRILLQDHQRFLSRSQDLELQLTSKERLLDQLLGKQKRLEHQCTEMHSEQQETRVENVKLKQTNSELAHDLELTSQELGLAQEQLAVLQEQAARLREDREMEMYRVTEGLQRERESLLKQLDLLREMNKHLRDERDVVSLKPKNMKTPPWNQKTFFNSMKHSDNNNVFQSEEDVASPHSKRRNLVHSSYQTFSSSVEEAMNLGPPSRRLHLPRIISIEEDHLPQLLQEGYQSQSSSLQEWSECEEAEAEDEHIDLVMSDILMSPTSAPTSQPPQRTGDVEDGGGPPTSPRGQPVGKETSLNEEGAVSPPDRLFKIVLVGNSSVGKTSLLKRFCDDCFYPDTSATVGIDYSVKTITVDNSKVALQIWDTAGQERYRSITKQFFRKADGVVVMYDITCELSFTSVRQWLTSVQDSAGEDITIMLLGNKTDLESDRLIPGGVAEQLAKECQLIFYECSACSGHNVVEAMTHLARILKEQEDKEKEKTVQLVNTPSQKRSFCC